MSDLSREELTGLAKVLHRDARRRPVLSYRCRAARCLMFEVYTTPLGPLIWKPSQRVSAAFARRNGHPDDRVLPAWGALLEDLTVRADGGLISGLATCEHYADRLTAADLLQEAQEAARTRRQAQRVLPADGSDAALVGRLR